MKLTKKTVRIIRNILELTRISAFYLALMLVGLTILFADGDLVLCIICAAIAVVCFGISYAIEKLFYTE